MTQTCYSQWEEKLYFVTSFFFFLLCFLEMLYIHSDAQTDMHQRLSMSAWIEKGRRRKDPVNQTCRWWLTQNRRKCLFAVRDIFQLQFILSGCAETFQFVPRIVFSNIMGKMPNAIKPFWNSVALNIRQEMMKEYKLTAVHLNYVLKLN